ncbi:MAG: DUF1045 domain-containing protein [Candidatus Puniceispirillales bacterium]
MNKYKFKRFAFYFLPPLDSPLSCFGAGWLGWSIDRGEMMPFLDPVSCNHSEIIAKAQKYGFHGTLKPPFRLHQDTCFEDLVDAANTLMANVSHFNLPQLMLNDLDGFFVLRPKIDCPDVINLAHILVTKLDHFRALSSEEELQRRRSNGLTERQDKLLIEWGYPYVLEEFRFHLTLTKKLDQFSANQVYNILQNHLTQEMLTPIQVKDIGLVGEAEDGRFHLIKRIPFGH